MTRDELYQKFGPRLIEAIVLVVKDEINVLRVEAGLPERTNQQLLSALENKLTQVTPYTWEGDSI